MSDRAARCKAIFAEVSELPPERWRAELDARLGPEDADLRREVESLLKFHEGAGAFLNPEELRQSLAGDLPRIDLDVEPDLLPGQRLGEYTIERLLGAGGMGSVYLARQDKPARTVAVKVIRKGLASRSMMRRFEAEAEVLGRLHHPGIAQIYEAGEAVVDGQGPAHPFIAMEFVDGPPITDYVEQAGIDTAGRLELLARVCEAVHHAHQRGIIHRDLKPGNILVDRRSDEPQPKVLDFGVARAVDSDPRVTTVQTSVGQLIGTLPYMSPEQVAGDPRELDVRSDVYALGVVMFQLLTGRLPHDLSNRSLVEAARVIREEPHTRLSSVSRVFRGEIETVVAKALEKDKARRYQSAAELAEDLRRYLRGEAIMARQDSALYVIRKQLARHRWAVRAALVGLMALITFATYATWQAARNARLASDERDARTEADAARERADTLSRQLAAELGRARIELGRLEGAARRLPLAERTLWTEYLHARPRAGDDPRFTSESRSQAYWALWELYDRLPCAWTRPTGLVSRFGGGTPDGRVFVVGSEGGHMVFLDAKTGKELRRMAGLGPVSCVAVGAEDVFIGRRDGAVAAVPIGAIGDLEEFLPALGPEEAGEGERLVVMQAPGGAAVRSIALSADGTYLLTSGADGEARLWDARGRRLERSWKAHDGAVTASAFSLDGLRITTAPAIVHEDDRVRVWDRSTGRLLHEVRPEGRFTPTVVTLLPARTAAGAGDGGAGGGESLPERLLIGDDARRMRMLDLLDGRLIAGVTMPNGPASVLRLAPDGERLLVAAGHSSMVLDVATLAPRFQHGDQQQSILAADWVSNDAYVLAAFNGITRRLGASASPSLTTARIAPHWCFGLAVDPATNHVAVAGTEARIRVLDVPTLRQIGVAAIQAWEQDRFRGRSRAMVYLPTSGAGGPSGLLAGIWSGQVHFFEAGSWEQSGEAGASPASTFRASDAEIYAVALSPDGRLLATGAANGDLKLWDARTGALVRDLPRQRRRVEGLAFSPDGRLLAAAGRPEGITLFEAATGREVATLETSAIPWGVAFTPDGETILCSLFDGRVDAFAASPPRRRRTVQAHQRLIPALAVHPSGQVFATGSEDGVITLWQTATLHKLVSWEPMQGEIITAAFDVTGRYLLASSAGGVVVRIDLASSCAAIDGNRAVWEQGAAD